MDIAREEALAQGKQVKEAVENMIILYLLDDIPPRKEAQWAKKCLPENATPEMRKEAERLFAQILIAIERRVPQIIEESTTHYLRKHS